VDGHRLPATSFSITPAFRAWKETFAASLHLLVTRNETQRHTK
jgi:hypothetical protein